MNKKKSYSSHALVPVKVGGVEYTVEAEATEWGDNSIGPYEWHGRRCVMPPQPYCEGFSIPTAMDEEGDQLDEDVIQMIRDAIDDDPDLYSEVLTALDENREDDDYGQE